MLFIARSHYNLSFPVPSADKLCHFTLSRRIYASDYRILNKYLASVMVLMEFPNSKGVRVYISICIIVKHKVRGYICMFTSYLLDTTRTRTGTMTHCP